MVSKQDNREQAMIVLFDPHMMPASLLTLSDSWAFLTVPKPHQKGAETLHEITSVTAETSCTSFKKYGFFSTSPILECCPKHHWNAATHHPCAPPGHRIIPKRKQASKTAKTCRIEAWLRKGNDVASLRFGAFPPLPRLPGLFSPISRARQRSFRLLQSSLHPFFILPPLQSPCPCLRLSPPSIKSLSSLFCRHQDKFLNLDHLIDM